MIRVLQTTEEVTDSRELSRILAIPRRVWSPEDADKLAHELTQVLRRADSKATLRPVQAIALHEIATRRGMLGPIVVGGGKTLISLLFAAMLQAKRPMLLLPAALIEKTHRELQVLIKDWKIPRNLRMLSYDKLSRVGGSQELEFYRPDAICADEVHKLKNKRAAVTRRVLRYMHKEPATAFVAMSGTITQRSVKDFAHIAQFALRDYCPLPEGEGELDEWACALDERVKHFSRRDPGALMKLCTPEERASDDPLTAVRQGFQRRLVETPGVVASGNSKLGTSLYILPLEYAVSQVTEDNFKKLRTEWRTPDDWDISEAAILWQHARQLALGFHYIWDPRPPLEWMNRRREWKRFVRDYLARSHKLDSEKQVALECIQNPKGRWQYEQWVQVKDSFVPNQCPVWHDESALNVCADWARRHPGIIWTEHTFFAEELARRTGLKYYGAKGLARDATFIEDASPAVACIASRAANCTGRNLQYKFHRNLITAIPTSGEIWEQLLGRTHREGQPNDEVTVEYLVGCKEHLNAFEQAESDASYQQLITGQPQKLVYADKVRSEKVAANNLDYRWS